VEVVCIRTAIYVTVLMHQWPFKAVLLLKLCATNRPVTRGGRALPRQFFGPLENVLDIF